MSNTTGVLTAYRRTMKLYDQLLRQVCRPYELNQVEATIISFLHNNPGLDTAGDISDMRFLPKGNVSQGVEALIQRSLLVRRQDQQDRRKIHLSLTPEALPIVADIDACTEQFYQQLFSGFSREEVEAYSAFHARLLKNVEQTLERTAHQ